jgi:class 3 adenylate cyclase
MRSDYRLFLINCLEILKPSVMRPHTNLEYYDIEIYASELKSYPNKSESVGSELLDSDKSSNYNNQPWEDKSLNLYDPKQQKSVVKTLELQEEIHNLKKIYLNTLNKLNEVDQDKSKLLEELKTLEDLRQSVSSKEKINHILPRVNEIAKQKLLLPTDDFKDKFADGYSTKCVVISIDIRHSTELMLRARTATQYSKFITELTTKLSNIIIENFGVFDKFTGDGILAFFPEFYSDDDSMLYALRAAKQCHQVFADHYYSNKECFTIIIKNVGLGIGIDYGYVSLVNQPSELTVVGIPVVYACRMAGTASGTTLLNQPAFEAVKIKYGNHLKTTEAEINIKNEGVALAYQVEVNENSYGPLKVPEWYSVFENASQSGK